MSGAVGARCRQLSMASRADSLQQVSLFPFNQSVACQLRDPINASINHNIVSR